MSIIDLLIAPITEDNIVNNIKLQKKSSIPFASKILPNSKRRKNYQFKYNNKIFNNILQGSKQIVTDHSIDVKATAQLGMAVDIGNELEYLNYIRNASIFKLRKIKPSQYMGLRIGPMNADKKEMKLYNFSERWVSNLTGYDENEKVIRYDKFNKEPMLDPALFRSVFNDKHRYPPVLPSMLEDAEETGYEIETPAQLSAKFVPDVLEAELQKEEEREKAERIFFTNRKKVRGFNIFEMHERKKREQAEKAEAEREQAEREQAYYRQSEMSEERERTISILSAYKKQKRNNIIRKILTDKKYPNIPSRITEKFVNQIFDESLDIDPNVVQLIIQELEKQHLNV